MQNKFMGSIVALLKWKWKKCGDILGGIQPIRTAPEAALSRRDQKIARLYEQGASKERVWAYLRRWLGWAGTTCCWASVVLSIGCARIVKMHNLNEYNCKDISIVYIDINQIKFIEIDNKKVNWRNGNFSAELLPGEHTISYKFMLLGSIAEIIFRQRQELKYDFIAGKMYNLKVKYEYGKVDDKEERLYMKKLYGEIEYDRECIDEKDIRKDVTKKD